MFLGIADVFAADILAQALIRVTSVNHDNIRVLFPQLSYYAVHMERLAASRRAEAEEVAVVCQFLFAFLARYINGDGDTLPVCIVHLQRGVFTFGQLFLVHQASCCVTEGEETVIILVERITVSGEGADKQFQLVIRPLANLYTDTSECVLQMIGAFLQVGIRINRYHKIEVTIDQLLVLPCDKFFDFLDVFHGNQVARIGQRGVAVLFLCQLAQFLFLTGQEDDLVENNALGIGNAVYH